RRATHLCLLFFSLPPRPPSSPLFPYTTLFRSRSRAFASLGLHQEQLGRQLDVVRERGPAVGEREVPVDPEAGPVDRAGQPHCKPDRKSTRLNSSHVAISYAVFCLKKKKKNRKK